MEMVYWPTERPVSSSKIKLYSSIIERILGNCLLDLLILRLAFKTIVVRMCPHLPFDQRFPGQGWYYNVVHDSIVCASLPLPPGLTDEVRMCNKADAMYDISQLPMSVHSLRNP